METCGRDAAVRAEERDYEVEHLPPLLEDEVREMIRQRSSGSFTSCGVSLSLGWTCFISEVGVGLLGVSAASFRVQTFVTVGSVTSSDHDPVI